MADVRRPVALVRACNEAIGAYSPPPYPGRVVLVRPREGAGAEARDPTLGWQERVRGELKPCRVPGNHQTMVRSPHLGELAEKLSALLATAS